MLPIISRGTYMQQSANNADARFSWQEAIDRQPLDQTAGLYSTRLACLSVTGKDATAFLQGQISIDMRELVYAQETGRASLATRLDLKGRVVAVFWVAAVADGYRLLLPSSMVDTLLADLGKYIVFSKATIERLPLTVVAVSGAGVAAGEVRMIGGAGFSVGTHIGDLAYSVADNLAAKEAAGLTLVAASDRQLQEFWQPFAEAQTISGASPCVRFWESALIAAGVVMAEATTAGLWLPQELGSDTLGAVSFSKGCYLGQEVVARLHFKGKVKQRLYRLELQADAPQALPAVGAVVTTPAGDKLGQLAAVVGMPAVTGPAHRLSCLLVLKQACDTHMVIGNCKLKVMSCHVAFAP